MFPLLSAICCGGKCPSRKEHQEQRLKFLKWVRDDMETRLAGLNAAIASIESQVKALESESAE